MDIRRFGPGHRRSDGPPGTQAVDGAVIYHDGRLHVSELAFGRYAMVTPHSNPTNTALFVVISGGGFVQVGAERTRVNHGEAVLWPAGELHGAYTDGNEMRAIVIEFAASEGALLEGTARELPSQAAAGAAARGEGRLAEPPRSPDDHDTSQGEPW
jgi:quercetin dioxygenase-like cupin family protein